MIRTSSPSGSTDAAARLPPPLHRVAQETTQQRAGQPVCETTGSPGGVKSADDRRSGMGGEQGGQRHERLVDMEQVEVEAADLIRLRDRGSAAIGTLEPFPGTERLSRSTPGTPSGARGRSPRRYRPSFEMHGQAQDLCLDSTRD